MPRRCLIAPEPGRVGPGFLLAVSSLAARALAYEILLLRLFSAILWHHFAAAVISLALLGYGASGSALVLAQQRLRGRLGVAYPAGCVLFGILAPASFAVAQRVPFNPLVAVWEPGQWGLFAAVYFLLAVPFFVAGGCAGLALRELGTEIPRLYRADLVGAGAGALAAVGLLSALPPAGCLRAVGAGGFVAAALALAALAPSPGRRRPLPWAVVAAGVATSVGWPAAWLEPRPSEYKALAQALRAPGAAAVFESWGSLGHLAAVRSPQVSFRYAPGLSLGCPWEVPEQVALFSDGEFTGAVDRADADPRYRGCLPTALPYALGPRPRVLVLGAGGGAEVRGALGSGAAEVDAVEFDGRVVELLEGPLAPYAGPVYGAPGVRPRVAEARAFVGASDQVYDLIQVALLDSLGASLAGAQAASESFLYTVEAFEAFLAHLSPGGVLAVTRWLEVPPRGALKLFATAAAALERRGAEQPGEHLALVRTWSTATLLVRNGPFPPEELEAVRAFCRDRGFDLAWLPGLAAAEANRYAVLDRPWLYEGALELLGPDREGYFRRYKFFVEPATDDRPYFFHTLKWASLPELLAARDRGGASLVEWAHFLAPATLIQAILAGAVLLLLPLRRLRLPDTGGLGRGRVGIYFGALGLAFLSLEVVTIQRLTLLLGHPVYAAASTLAAFLVFAGLGSEVAGRWVRSRGRSGAIATATGGAAVLALAYQVVLPWLFPYLSSLSLGARAAVAVGLIGPLALVMGMPFPLGLGAVAARAPEVVPWAWGVNGFASVASAALAAVLGVHLGFTGVTGVAAGLYVVATWAARGWDEASPPGLRRSAGGGPRV